MARTAPTSPANSRETVANGLFSTAPSPRCVRPLVGALLLAMVEAGLVLGTSQAEPLLKAGAVALLLLSTLVIVLGGRHERRQREPRR